MKDRPRKKPIVIEHSLEFEITEEGDLDAKDTPEFLKGFLANLARPLFDAHLMEEGRAMYKLFVVDMIMSKVPPPESYEVGGEMFRKWMSALAVDTWAHFSKEEWDREFTEKNPQASPPQAT